MSFTDKREEFLALLDVVKSVTPAARDLGINRNTAYAWARAAGVSSRRTEDPRKAEFLSLRREGLTRKAAGRTCRNQHPDGQGLGLWSPTTETRSALSRRNVC